MTHSIEISKIIISPDRQRQDFNPDHIQDLANSIAAHGLLHPPVMRDSPDGPVLVAGERRLRAFETLWMLGNGIRHNGITYPPEVVPYASLGELDALAAEEAELDENLKRQDLSWQEEASAISRLHSLRIRQATALGESHSVDDTTRELKSDEVEGKSNSVFHYHRTEIKQNLILADHLSNPEIAKAKSPKEAIKILQRQENSAKNEALAQRVGKTFNSSVHKLYHQECLEWMRTCPDNTFDVILTDPPYGMDAQNFGDGAGRLANSEHHYDDSYDSWQTLIHQVSVDFYRIAKPQAHAYIFCDFDRFHQLKSLMEAAGWYVFRTPLVNFKPNSGRVPLPEHGPRRQYEICLYAIKGKRPTTGIYSDVISTVLEENLTHGAQKPVELYVNLLRRSVRPGDLVLDAFAGTGTIFPAAHQCKCAAVGIERSPEYYGIAVSRLNELDDELTLI